MNFNLLRPVVFTNLKVNEVLKAYSGLDPVVAYKGPNFAVLRFKDGSEGTFGIFQLETIYKLAPLCWVEEKPVYPKDVLYYKYDPAWKHNEEGVIASGVRDDELHFHGGIAFPIADATWTKPEPKRVPSFQVEGRDVFPGDTVYYYGSQRSRWGITMTVENGRRVVEHGFACIVDDYSMGSESFRLKPQFLIGDRLVPMPEREAPAVGTIYYSPHIISPGFYSSYEWSGCQVDNRRLKRGLVHLNKKAATIHGRGIVNLSNKKD